MTSNASTTNLQVDIVSDVVCPWCIIGYLQLHKALEEMPGDWHVDIRWQPFELNPDMPADGQELGEHLAQKYGRSAEQGTAVRDHLSALGESLGFNFDYFPGMRMVNTFQAHQLLHWAGLEGRQTALKLALFEAFFSRREDVGDPGLLARVAGRVGLDEQQATLVLADERYAVTVREQEIRWRDRDIYAVPTFVFNDGPTVPGAQDAETFRRLLSRIAAA